MKKQKHDKKKQKSNKYWYMNEQLHTRNKQNKKKL